jgi:hypothetical protein
MCGWVAKVIDFDKLTVEQRKELGKYLRERKAEASTQLEKINASLKLYNQDARARRKRPADLHVIKRGA